MRREVSCSSRRSTSSSLPTADEALPGRDEPMPVPARHDVLGNPLVPPFPDGLEQAVFGMGCFWGAERKFWQAPGVCTTAVGYAGGSHAQPDLRGGLLGRAPATPRSCSSSSTRRRSSYDELLRVFWEGHDPTQGMRQGNDVGTQYRSAIYTTRRGASVRRPRPRGRRYQERAARGGPRRDHDRDRRPAPTFYYAEDYHQQYLAKNPRRLLRPRRHRRRLPGRRRTGVGAGSHPARRCQWSGASSRPEGPRPGA